MRDSDSGGCMGDVYNVYRSLRAQSIKERSIHDTTS
jgi:hypothetical protein